MDQDMDRVKKTTLLFPPDMYAELAALARRNKSSVGELVRAACRAQYALSDPSERVALVERLGKLSLPVGSPEEMERESVLQVVDPQ